MRKSKCDEIVAEVCDARPITPTRDAVMFGSWADDEDDDESENTPMEMYNGGETWIVVAPSLMIDFLCV